MNAQERLLWAMRTGFPDTTEGDWQARAAAILAADPDLEADLDLGMAWREAEKALPDGATLMLGAGGDTYYAESERPNVLVKGEWVGGFSIEKRSAAPTAALTDLTRALTDRLNATEGQPVTPEHIQA